MSDSTHQPDDEGRSSINDALGDRVPLVKAVILGGELAVSNTVDVDDRAQKIFSRAGAIEPPYDPATLTLLIEHSNSLRQNIDAYVTNIDGFGHRFDPTLDLDSDQTFDIVREAMIEERRRGVGLEARVDDAIQTAQEAVSEARKAESGNKQEDEETPDDGADGEGDVAPEDDSAGAGTAPEEGEASLVPSDAEVQERIKSIERLAVRERRQIEQFFKFCCVDESFTSLRRKTRFDHELLGNAYWEILRDASGAIVQFVYVPGFTVRLLPADKAPLRVPMRVMTTAITYDVVSVARRFRRYVQVVENHTVFFKQFGDKRTVSAKTGKLYINEAALEAAEGSEGPVIPATEIIHWKIHSPRSAYGVPRWVGNLLSVLGSRQAEEVNFLYFQNKSVPPLAVLVSGGRLAKDSLEQIKNHIAQNIRGKANFHKILLLEAAPASGATISGAGSSGVTRIELKPLTSAIEKDALFQNYDVRNAEKVGQSFRIPKLLRGDIDNFPGRATAEAALGFAETQVFAPEREDFDWHINRTILSEMQICFWKFVSNTPKTRNAKETTEILTKLSDAGLIIPKEGRQVAAEVLNRELEPIDQPWMEQPMPMTLKGIDQSGFDDEDEGDDETDEELQAAADKADMSVADLRAAGLLGVKQRRRRGGYKQLPPPSLLAQAKQLVALRNIYRTLEAQAAERETAEAIDDRDETRKSEQADGPPEEIVIPYAVHKGEWVTPDDPEKSE